MESTFVLTRCGDDLFCITVDTPQEAQALALRLGRAAEWLEIVPGIASVVVRFDAAVLDSERASRTLEDLLKRKSEMSDEVGELLELPVVYGGEFGPDLGDLSTATGLSVDELVASHTGGEYTVDMVGFTPGFAFVGGLEECFHIPRRTEPRQRVAAGSVGIADGRTGLYALASPGGWNIIGRTPYPLFDPGAGDPFALKAGMRVRFVAIDAAEFEA